MTSPITLNSIQDQIEEMVAGYAEKSGIPNIWRVPLLACAPADSRFDILPDIAKPDHSLPKNLLATAKTVVTFFIPFTKTLAMENHKSDIPCRNWGLAYQHTNNLINEICETLKRDLDTAGFKTALVQATHNFDEQTLMARWSHKHVAYIAGLGRFGVNAQFITPSGCAGRLGSFVTEIALDERSLVTQKELCLYKTKGTCLICVDRCPVDAVSAETGIDRQKCWARLNDNLHHTRELEGLENTTHVCGKCQVFVPCSLKIPK